MEIPSVFGPGDRSITLYEGINHHPDPDSIFRSKTVAQLGCGNGWISIALAEKWCPSKVGVSCPVSFGHLSYGRCYVSGNCSSLTFVYRSGCSIVRYLLRFDDMILLRLLIICRQSKLVGTSEKTIYVEHSSESRRGTSTHWIICLSKGKRENNTQLFEPQMPGNWISSGSALHYVNSSATYFCQNPSWASFVSLKVYGLDINPRAIKIAWINLYLNALDDDGLPIYDREGKTLLDRVEFHESDLLFYCRDNKIELDSIVGCIPQVRSNEIVVDPELKENADSYNLIFRFLNPIQRQCQRLSLKI